MEFQVTREGMEARMPELIKAGESLGITSSFLAVDGYSPGDQEDFSSYLDDYSIEFFSVEEVIRPNHPDTAREVGYEVLIPPLHLWPWSLLVLRVGDRMRRAVDHPVRLRNLYRPMSYNALVASSGIDSDHPNACAGDFDFRTGDHRRVAEDLIRDLSRAHPELDVSLGLGARTLHVGIMSPKGKRHWFYDSYDEPRIPLD